ncbi:MAG: tRNA (adenosine(37)-N6)-threonylcarbamoyltransferase complex transferase subunit TsaD, partial [Pseudomonadota bacterium]
MALCTDNAAMIAAATIEQMQDRSPDDMALSARPRMPLDTASTPMMGSGKKGAKA